MTSFTLTLPPGWARVDLTDDVARSLDRFVSLVARQVPPTRQPGLRQLLNEHLIPRLSEFAQHGVACVVIPTAPGYEQPVRPVMTFTPIPALDDVDPLLMLQALAGEDASAELVDVEGLVAVRTHATVDATQTAQDVQPVLDQALTDPSLPRLDVDLAALDIPAGMGLVSSRVRYTMGNPDDRDKWIDVQMAVDHPTTPEAEELALGAISLFDAVISTFRWDA